MGKVTMTDTFVVRQLENSDLPQVANILAEGFPKYSLAFWHNRRHAMAQRERARLNADLCHRSQLFGNDIYRLLN